MYSYLIRGDFSGNKFKTGQTNLSNFQGQTLHISRLFHVNV